MPDRPGPLLCSWLPGSPMSPHPTLLRRSVEKRSRGGNRGKGAPRDAADRVCFPAQQGPVSPEPVGNQGASDTQRTGSPERRGLELGIGIPRRPAASSAFHDPLLSASSPGTNAAPAPVPQLERAAVGAFLPLVPGQLPPLRRWGETRRHIASPKPGTHTTLRGQEGCASSDRGPVPGDGAGWPDALFTKEESPAAPRCPEPVPTPHRWGSSSQSARPGFPAFNITNLINLNPTTTNSF